MVATMADWSSCPNQATRTPRSPNTRSKSSSSAARSSSVSLTSNTHTGATAASLSSVGEQLAGDVGELAFGGAGAAAEQLEGVLGIDPLAFHEDTLGLLDQDPGSQGELE